MRIVLIGGPRHREEYETINPTPLVADYSRKSWAAGAQLVEQTPTQYYIHRRLGDSSARASMEKHKRGEAEPVPPRN